MINVYFKEGVELGYDFYFFPTEEYGEAFQKYDYESQLKHDLLEIKLQILRTNVEDFIMRFDNHTMVRNELHNTALNRLVAFLNWSWKTEDIKEVCKNLRKVENFIITIVNAYSGKERQRAIKEWKFIMQFIDNELQIQ